MSWRVVMVGSRAKLDYKMDYLVIRTGETTKRIHLSEISVLIIESTAVSLTAYLLCELTKRKIEIIFCDEKRLPYGSLLSLYGSHDSSLKLRKQIAWDEHTKDDVWREIIKAKIRGQIYILNALGKNEDNHTESELLSSYLDEILPGDPTNREGHAAKVYFNAIFGMTFSRTKDCAINSALNYGYSIMLSTVAREIVSAGYATQLGVFHANMFNKYNLASDLMEPFRPFVDAEVIAMNPLFFEHDEKVRLVKLLNKEIVIEGKRNFLINAIKIYCYSVFDALEENDVSKITFPSYEL